MIADIPSDSDLVNLAAGIDGAPARTPDEVRMTDSLLACAATLAGAADALRYRAAADADDMLDLLAATIDDQADALRNMIRA